MKLISETQAVQPEIQALRRDIHAHPELCFEEQRASNLVAAKLAERGIEVHHGLGKTDLVGVTRNGEGKSIGLRADTDALPLAEANQFEHRLKHSGKMHTCGYDGHAAMLFGAAHYLFKHRNFSDTVNLILQPAEGGDGGAREMIKDGLLDRFPCDTVLGLHNWPEVSIGAFGTRAGALMASSSEFRITTRGRGAHVVLPHNGNDPVFAGAQVVSALQGIITRNKQPIDTAVLSVMQFHAGDAINIVPNETWIGGTVRTFSTDVLDLIKCRMEEVSKGIIAAYHYTVDFVLHRSYPPTVNTEPETQFAAVVMRELVGVDNVDAGIDLTVGAEDFSFMLIEKPGCFAFIGNGDGDHHEQGHGLGPCMLYDLSYDFNDELLSLGATYWVRLVGKFLARS